MQKSAKGCGWLTSPAQERIFMQYKTMRPLSLVQGTKLTGNLLFPSRISNDRPVWQDSDAANINIMLPANRRRSSRLLSKWSIYSRGCMRIFQFARSLEEGIYNRTYERFFQKFFFPTSQKFSPLFPRFTIQEIHHSWMEIRTLRNYEIIK